MTTFIVLALVILLAKFIYDTYITGNTTKDWEEFKKNHPHESRVVQSNKGLNLRTKASLRTDGYYVCRHNGSNYAGDKIMLTLVLVFTDFGYCFFENMEGHPVFSNDDMKELMSELLNEHELSVSYGKYKQKENGSIKITLLDPNDFTNEDLEYPMTYKRLEGTIITNGLMLDLKMHGYVHDLGKFAETSLISDLNYEFVKVNFA